MTVSERLQQLIDALQTSMADCKDVLLEKGVETPDSAKFSQLANYIRLIFQSEFEWMFNFQNIDQFGNPHTPNRGQSIPDGTVEQFYLPMMKFTVNPNWESEEDSGYIHEPLIIDFNIENPVLTICPKGVFGTLSGMTRSISPDFDFINNLVMFDFNEDIFPEEFHPETT